MYISLTESHAKGFMKWANTYQPERRSNARAGAEEDRVNHIPEFQIGAARPVVGQGDIWDVSAVSNER
jgi:hypothetical protein